jgi:hypothetical protein
VLKVSSGIPFQRLVSDPNSRGVAAFDPGQDDEPVGVDGTAFKPAQVVKFLVESATRESYEGAFGAWQAHGDIQQGTVAVQVGERQALDSSPAVPVLPDISMPPGDTYGTPYAIMMALDEPTKSFKGSCRKTVYRYILQPAESS